MTCTVVGTETPTQETFAKTSTTTSSASATKTPTENPTATVTATETSGNCVVSGISFDQLQNTLTGHVSVSGRISIFFVDSEHNEHIVSGSTSASVGALSRSANYAQLPADSPGTLYESIGVEWRGSNNMLCRAVVPLEKSFRYYGMKIISQYNTPDESDSSCQTGGSKLSCVQEGNCSSANPTSFSGTFVKVVRMEGSALTSMFGYITGDLRSLCSASFLSCVGREKFRKFDVPTGSCGHPVVASDFAVDFSANGFGGGTFSCGNQLTLLYQNGKMDANGTIRDTCPGCRSARLDRYIGKGGCTGLQHYGYRLIVKYE